MSGLLNLTGQTVQEKIDANDRVVAIFTQNRVEVLDLAAPLEVLSHAGFKTYTFGLEKKQLISQRALNFTPQHDLQSAPKPDIIIFVGGGEIKEAAESKELRNWLLTNAKDAERVMSICTGAYFLANVGLLDGKEATTFHLSLDFLQERFPEVKVNREARVVADGDIITTAGISAGIDGCFYLLATLLGEDVAEWVAEHIEYNCWDPSTVKELARVE